ncbi:hypothetical protein ACV56Z_05655 [Staphylococcus aureus]
MLFVRKPALIKRSMAVVMDRAASSGVGSYFIAFALFFLHLLQFCRTTTLETNVAYLTRNINDKNFHRYLLILLV